ncbi:Y-family DNA polymerase [Candidatus Enterococcus mansonii]|uniref:UmuC domain-containing protein n=1 Tax=Candidatus Enterococcus mansonii TaxID=1834181 RepID=A0A242CK94_9ENTE|nr:Y-family DNA polymerase [Enterococcus sp. 4G2_DIV0659]OTO10656.1 hypothetical protein A5880_001340 [Enterococcus sp. 4G2_DIV0659]
MKFDYNKEDRRDVLCIDVKSFYASVECVQRGLHPLREMLVVMSHSENTSGLVLASSPMAKKKLGVSNVMRKWDLPDHPELKIVPPRMKLYIEENMKINSIYKTYVAEEDLLIYSIDESFLDITASKHLFASTSYELARKIQRRIYDETGLYVTVGIGDNPLLAKLALDNAAKYNRDFVAEWRYEDVPETVWKIHPITEMWGIGNRTAKRLELFGIKSVYDLAHANQYLLKERIGIIGQQLHAHAWGIDRSKLSDTYTPREKSYSNSQILPRDYLKKEEIEVVIREMTDQVAARIRRHHAQTKCVSLFIGYSIGYLDSKGKKGFHQQLKIPVTSSTKLLTTYCLELFRQNWQGQEIRHVGITYSHLVYTDSVQLDLFHDPNEQVQDLKLDLLIDTIRKKYGYTSLIHANSITKGGTAVSRASLVGGHAGGMDGIQE